LNYQETARNGRSAFKSPDYACSSKGAAGALKALILLDRNRHSEQGGRILKDVKQWPLGGEGGNVAGIYQENLP
jgi:hypothetical protein